MRPRARRDKARITNRKEAESLTRLSDNGINDGSDGPGIWRSHVTMRPGAEGSLDVRTTHPARPPRRAATAAGRTDHPATAAAVEPRRRTPRRAVGPGFVLGAVLASALLASGGTYLVVSSTPHHDDDHPVRRHRDQRIDRTARRPRHDAGGQASVVDIVKAVSPAVVTIVADGVTATDPTTGQTGTGTATGSGVIFDANGLILTNHHVVAGDPPDAHRQPQGRPLVRRHHLRHRHPHRPGHRQGRRDRPADRPDRRLVDDPGRPAGDRHRQPARRPSPTRSPAASSRPSAGRIPVENGDPDQPHPDRHRDQPRQQRRPAARPERQGHRHQHRRRRRQPGHRLRHPDRHRPPAARPRRRPASRWPARGSASASRRSTRPSRRPTACRSTIGAWIPTATAIDRATRSWPAARPRRPAWSPATSSPRSNGTTIDATHPFDLVMSQLSPGPTVKLDVLRDGQTTQVTVVLGTRPATDLAHRLRTVLDPSAVRRHTPREGRLAHPAGGRGGSRVRMFAAAMLTASARVVRMRVDDDARSSRRSSRSAGRRRRRSAAPRPARHHRALPGTLRPDHHPRLGCRTAGLRPGRQPPRTASPSSRRVMPGHTAPVATTSPVSSRSPKPGPSTGVLGDRALLAGLEVQGVAGGPSLEANDAPSRRSPGAGDRQVDRRCTPDGRHSERLIDGGRTEDVAPIKAATFLSVNYHSSGEAFAFAARLKEGESIWVAANTGKSVARLVFSTEGTKFGAVGFDVDGQHLMYGTELDDHAELHRIDMKDTSKAPVMWEGKAGQMVLDIRPGPRTNTAAWTVGTSCADGVAMAKSSAAAVRLLPDATKPTRAVGWLSPTSVLVATGGCADLLDLSAVDIASGRSCRSCPVSRWRPSARRSRRHRPRCQARSPWIGSGYQLITTARAAGRPLRDRNLQTWSPPTTRSDPTPPWTSISTRFVAVA